MSSRRDQVDAQRYMMGRVTGALVRAEPETAELPTRRDRTGTVVSVVLGIVLLGVVAIWALIPGSGSTRWRQPRTLVVDSSTGARYVLVDGRLSPVDDVATATLLAGGRLTPITVSSSQLAKVPRGAAVGTPAGPQVLPAASRINQGVWRACDLGAGRIVLDIGVPAAPEPLGDGQAVPVTADGKTYLLWGGRRLLLTQSWVADVLGLGLLVPVPVTTAWLDLIPLDGTVAPPSVPEAGSAGPTVAGRPTSIGQMFAVDMGNGTISHYLMTAGGLAPLTETEYLLKRAMPGSVRETPIGAADLVAAGQRSPVRPLTTLPAAPPQSPSTSKDAVVCVEYAGRADEKPRVVLATATDKPSGGSGPKTSVLVRVSPGGGALLMPPARAGVDPNRQQGLLVDERGIAYPVNGGDVTTLGYALDRAAVMPAALVAMVPVGPAVVRPGGG
ncbi:type VII secretion system ESX-2 subunit EccB2 [Micromonospora polyrhachis]|uniref:Type VII secretion protein EccB n=1 Tax=Micromonospora polyrhachis TaxID=1282883 RepID=A0A7W7SKE9_9ACTN|nr:type VII secretion protein EccB [Micromonospora polyrhachis]MBB4956428.1 type VII secretion protein EccB [Micromonospora polyrhachis]